MKLTPYEAFNALTVNGAAQWGLKELMEKYQLALSPGVILTKPLDNINQIPYLYGENFIDRVIV